METAHRKLKIKLLATRNTLLQNTIDHSKYITKTLQLEKYKFDFRSGYCDLNEMFCWSSAGQPLGSDAGQFKHYNNFRDRNTTTIQKKRDIFANWYKGNNPKDSIVRDLEYHDIFSAQRQNIAIAVDGHRRMWYVVDQSIHKCVSATGDT